MTETAPSDVPTSELDALREGAALCTHDLRAIARVTGADALQWLERIASHPVADMPAHGVRAATLMDGKGRMRAELRVLAPGEPSDGLLLDLPSSHRAAILKLLDMYVIKDDVQIEDVSIPWRLVSVLGPKAGDVLAACGLPLPSAGELAAPRDDLLVLRSELSGGEGYDLVFEGQVGRDLVGGLLQRGAVRASLAALDVLRVEHGVPWFAPDLSDGVIPLEALLDARVSITKGCYPGQEVVARIKNLGQVARKLVRVDAAGRAALQHGDELLGTGEQQGKPAGSLTSVAYDPGRDATYALAFVRRASWKEGTRLVTASGVEVGVHALD